MSANAPRTAAPRPARPDHLIVARDHAGLCLALRAIAAQGTFTVVVDRRKADRRQRYQTVRVERRRADRRGQPVIAADPRRRPYALLRQPIRPRATDRCAPGAP